MQAFRIIIALCFLSSSFADKPQQWLFINSNIYKSELKEFTLTNHFRFQQAESLSLYQIQPKYAFKLSDYFWGATNYSFFGVRQSQGNEDEATFSNQHRVELEIQPRIKLSDNLRLTGRDRIEYLLNESGDHLNHRFRHRSTLQYDRYQDSFASLVSQVEIFYDFGQSRWNQFRTSPLGLKFKLAKNNVALLPTLLSLHRDGDWHQSFVITLETNFDFTSSFMDK